ncbi:hypothetical protein KJ557_00825, partial [Patescibacteria group bacterium]|nr:hypothetical protein [Patescibacteria group bacterium]
DSYIGTCGGFTPFATRQPQKNPIKKESSLLDSASTRRLIFLLSTSSHILAGKFRLSLFWLSVFYFPQVMPPKTCVWIFS